VDDPEDDDSENDDSEDGEGAGGDGAGGDGAGGDDDAEGGDTMDLNPVLTKCLDIVYRKANVEEYAYRVPKLYFMHTTCFGNTPKCKRCSADLLRDSDRHRLVRNLRSLQHRSPAEALASLSQKGYDIPSLQK
jgi:hypothetical protein